MCVAHQSLFSAIFQKLFVKDALVMLTSSSAYKYVTTAPKTNVSLNGAGWHAELHPVGCDYTTGSN